MSPGRKHVDPQNLPHANLYPPSSPGGIACSLIHKHAHFTPTREIKRHVKTLARNHSEGNVSPTMTNYHVASTTRSKGSLVQFFERNMTNFAAHTALKLIAFGKLNVDERFSLHRVAITSALKSRTSMTRVQLGFATQITQLT